VKRALLVDSLSLESSTIYIFWQGILVIKDSGKGNRNISFGGLWLI